MEKIKTKEDMAKKQRKSQIVLGIIMMILLVFATAGFALMNTDHGGGQGVYNYETREYNGIEFTRQETFWVTQINNKGYAFSYLPDELEDVEITIDKTLGSYLNKPLYHINADTARDILAFNMLPEFAQRVNEACLDEETCEGDFPIKSCDFDEIIIYEESDTTEVTRVYQDRNCIIIEGDKAKGTDKFLQRILSVE